MSRLSHELILQGRRRLRQLLPAARALAKEGKSRMDGTTMSMTVMPWGHEDNLEGVLVHRAPKGGWHCDVLLKHTPPGVPNSCGSPMAFPYATEAEAEAAALWLLAAVLHAAGAQAMPVQESPDRVFVLHGVDVILPGAVFDKFMAALPPGFVWDYDEEFAVGRVRAVLAKWLPGPVTQETLEALPASSQFQIMSVLMMATLSGVYVYPKRAAEPLSEASDAVH